MFTEMFFQRSKKKKFRDAAFTTCGATVTWKVNFTGAKQGTFLDTPDITIAPLCLREVAQKELALGELVERREATLKRTNWRRNLKPIRHLRRLTELEWRSAE